MQAELSSSTSIQGEYRYRSLVYGDNRLRFFPDDFFPGEVNREERQTARFGIRHALTSNSTLLGSFIFQHSRFTQKDDQLLPLFTFQDFKNPQDLFQGEAQHLYRSTYFNVVSGFGYAKINGRFFTTIGLPLPPPDDILAFPGESDDQKHVNLYNYLHWSPTKALTVTLGASGDFVDTRGGNFESKDQFNPKFGIVWNPWVDTTVRGAAFRVLKRTLITDQTLEPTQVAGFNQFFDDINGTEAWRYGVAVDQKFTKEVFGGIEYSGRNLKVPLTRLNNNGQLVEEMQDAEEQQSRVYFFWTPHPWFALRTEYQFEHFTREGTTSFPARLNTHRVPLGLNFFHSSGLSAVLQPTYYHQNGKFNLKVAGVSRNGSDDFWTLDLALNWRLPMRYGFVTIGATNLLDKKFNYFDLDFKNPRIQPTRTIFGRISLALP